MQIISSFSWRSIFINALEQGSSHGECETWYQISRLPMKQVYADTDLLPIPELCQGHDVYEIIKDRNLGKCRSGPMFGYQSATGFKCNASNAVDCQNMFAVCKYFMTSCTKSTN